MPSKTTKFEKLLEAVPDALVGMDQKGVVRFVNRQTEALFGYDRDDLIGQNIERLVPEPLWQIYAQNRDEYFADPRTRSSGLEVELVGRRRDGGEFPINVSMSHIDTGDVLLVITAVADVTKHMVAVRNAQLLAAIVDASDDAIVGTTLEGVITSWNPAAERMYGYPAKEILGRSGSVLATTEEANEIYAIMDRTRAGEVVEHLEIEHRRKDGTVFPVSVTIAPISDENGTIVGSSAVARDVTERKEAFEAAQRLAAIVQSSEDAIFGSGLDGTITSWNQAAERLLGYSAQEMIGKSGRRLSPRGRTGEPRTILAKIGAGQHVEHLETVRVRKDGTAFPVSLTVSPIRARDGAVVGASAILRDVTEQRQASETSQRMAALVEYSEDAIVSMSPDGIITSWNPAAEKVYGYSSEEVVDRPGRNIIPEGRARELNAILASVKGGHVLRQDCELPRKDGTPVQVSITLSPIRDVDGEVVGVVSLHRDVTEQKKAGEAAQQMAAIVDFSDDAIIGTTLDGVITTWNAAATRMFGYARTEIIGTADLLTPEDRTQEASTNLSRITSGEHVVNFETYRARKDGSVFPVSITGSPIFDDGTVVGASVILRDLTETQKAARYARGLIEASLDPMAAISPEGVITDVNEAAVKITGLPREALIGSDFSRYVSEPDKANEAFRQAFEQGSVTDLPLTLCRSDGTLTDLSCNLSCYRDPSGLALGVLSTARDVTAQKHVLATAQRLAAIVESSDDAILSGSLDGTITSWNPAAEAIYGYSREEIVGQPINLLIPEDRREETTQILDEIGAGQHPAHLETIRLRKDGTAIPVSITISPIWDPDGAVVATCAVHHDMTTHLRRLEAAQRLAAIVNSSEDAILGETLEGVITSWNPAAEVMFGYSSTEIIGQSVSLLIPQGQAGQAQEVAAKVSAGQSVRHLETVNVRKDGTEFPVSLTLCPIRDPDGAVAGASVTCRDVTEQEHAAQYARSLIEAAPDPLVTISPGGKIDDVNEATVKITGVPRNKLIGTDFSRYFTDPGKAHEGYEHAFTQGSVTDFPLTLRHRDGTLTDVLYNASIYRNSGGEVLGLFAAARDVTQQKKANETARHMAAIVESSNDAIISGSLDGLVRSWNPAAERMYGYSGAEIVGKPATTLTPPDRADEIKSVLAKIKAGQSVDQLETKRIRKDGSIFPVLLTVSPVLAADGAVVGTSAIHRDLTAQKGALADAQRIAAIVEYSDDAIISRTLDGTITSWNPAAERMFGYSGEEIVGKPIGLLIPQERGAEMISLLAKISSGKSVTNFETTRLRKDGTPITVCLTTSPHRDDKGTVVGASVIFRDVTELRQAAQYTRSLIEAAPDPLVTISPSGKIDDVNEATVTVTGVPRNKLIGTDFSHYFTDPGKAHEGYEQAFTQGSVTDFPLTLRHRDGTLTDVLYNASIYRNAGGEVLGVFAAARDVTQQKKAFETAQHMAAIVENSNDAILGITLDGVITSWNPAAERIFGYSSETIVRRPITLLSPKDRAGDVKATLAKISEGRPVDDLETICLRQDGTTFPVKFTVAPIRDAQGAIVASSAIVRDLTGAQ